MTVLKYEYNPGLVLEKVRKLLDVRLAAADDTVRTAEWLACFSNDAMIWRNGNASNGRTEIEGMIANSWDNVASRDHRPAKIFAFDKDSLDVMIDGTTVYNWQDGSSKTGIWACRVVFKEVGGALKISDYHVVFF
ncbi:hypothetical protein CDV36_004834 [Fusarium kuroshium]|uniref:SnoaL-like domain-containing protein n=1 Tax=Fusarium kuroshium TaxID=2010991 RepID=A0A3M2SD72_9HYPO|nr:hypothetical protein CDV36_004834 [Fusarium kuroshium]